MTRFILSISLICAAFLSTANAQLPTDGLRLWLKADSLALTEDARVTQWVDSSPYGTIFAPRVTSEPDGPLGGSPIEEYPHFQTVILNGSSIPTVAFERNGSVTVTGNPSVDRSGSTDRLFQVNNRTPGSDPLAIGDGTSVTSFTVFMPNVTTAGTLGFQSIWAKRGNSASLLELGIRSSGHFNYVTYDSVTDYRTTNPGVANKWHLLAQTITEAGANDPLAFLINDTEDPNSPFVLNPVFNTSGGVILDRNDSINNDPVGLVEPFAIGSHAQDCCGEGETFAGNIAEIIIYARELSTTEFDQVTSYLTTKYLGAPTIVLGDYSNNDLIDAADYTVWRDNFGQFFALDNEDPAATTEGFVDMEDYDFWRSKFGSSPSGAAIVSVPEPATRLIAAIGAAIMITAFGRGPTTRQVAVNSVLNFTDR